MNANIIKKNPILLKAARLARRILGRGWMRAAHVRGVKANTVFFFQLSRQILFGQSHGAFLMRCTG